VRRDAVLCRCRLPLCDYPDESAAGKHPSRSDKLRSFIDTL
jgi:hypothetical protein